MATKHVTARLDAEVLARLDARGEAVGRKRPELMTRYIDEGLRMEEHPGVVFRSGPAGRRAGLAAGPDVWEVMRVVRNVEATGEKAIAEAATWLGLSPHQVEVAVGYYAAHAEEVDDWIARVDADAKRARAEWERRQDALA